MTPPLCECTAPLAALLVVMCGLTIGYTLGWLFTRGSKP